MYSAARTGSGFSTTDSVLTVFGIPTVHPFFWEANRGLVDVGTLGGVYSLANGLNSRGQVVGFSTTAGDETNHAFLWDQGVMQDLGTLGGTQSAANAINEKTEIVGEAFPVAEHSRVLREARRDDGYRDRDGCTDTNAGSINS
jgi:probable HAF family extracellular repeat protein